MRRIIILAVAVIAPSTALYAATAPVANASLYTCTSCASTSGANEYPIDENRAVNESGTGVCSEIWKYNGGSNYNLESQVCTSSESVTWAKSSKLDGHGEVRRWYSEFLYNLQGLQGNV
jgi:hypothetical protein